MLVFALPAKLEQARDAAVVEHAMSHQTAMARGDPTVVADRTEVDVAGGSHQRSTSPAIAAPPSIPTSAPSAKNVATPSPRHARAKLAQSSPPGHAQAAKTGMLAVARARPTPVALVKPPPAVDAAAQTVAEVPVPMTPKREAPLHVTAVAAFNHALEQCAERSVFVRTWCEHRARTRYCDAEGWSRPECAVDVHHEQGG